jgi:hypothetical protein
MPYLCISEKCPESSPRFATSRLWLDHMWGTHGRHWYREVYAPSSWTCPLCNDVDTTFPVPSKLTSHLTGTHGGIFTEPQIEAIVQQSRIQSLRKQDECPFCCLPIEAGKDTSSKKRSKSEGLDVELTSEQSQNDCDSASSHKRNRTETGYTSPVIYKLLWRSLCD